MKATELRIGNLVYDGGSITQLSLADFYNMYLDDKCEFKPITLTEEWLVKFGFRKMSESIYVCDMFSLLKTEFCFKYDGFTELCYVNQLQNLYFALTGEELTIK